MFDLIIIGAGPAGITAAVYAARKKMNTLVLTMDIGGQTAWSGDVENYTGYQFITGPELAEKFEEHMRKFDVRVEENEPVLDLSKSGDICLVTTDKGRYESRTVIVASGKRSKELNVPGEKGYKNRGLTYCATCDAPLFADKNVAVIGGGNSALDAALQLVRIAKQVYLINITEQLNADPVMQEQLNESKIVTVMNNARVTDITGEKFLTGIKVMHAGKQEVLAVEGVFVEIGLKPNSEFAKILSKNEVGEIKVNPRNETSVAGIFAAGDVTDVPEKQIVIAAGEGSKAALSAFRYLIQHKFS